MGRNLDPLPKSRRNASNRIRPGDGEPATQSSPWHSNAGTAPARPSAVAPAARDSTDDDPLRFGGGHRARRGDTRAAALALLAERPMHGYEMIKELDDRTAGAWVPSAGSVYPTLQLLEDEGLIEGEESEGRRRFSLTDAGRKENEGRAGDAPWEEVTAGYDPELLRLRRSAHQLLAALRQVGEAADSAERKRVRELLDETGRKVYGILAESD